MGKSTRVDKILIGYVPDLARSFKKSKSLTC